MNCLNGGYDVGIYVDFPVGYNDCKVFWGDMQYSSCSDMELIATIGSVNTFLATHTYATSKNTYSISLSKECIHFTFMPTTKPLPIELLAWGEGIESANNSFRDCFNLKKIPSWGYNITTCINCYINCESISIAPEWNFKMEDVSGCYLSPSRPNYKIYTMPKWSKNIKYAANTFNGCRNMTKVWTENPSELMPSHILTHENCVANTKVDKYFLQSWGGSL